VAIWFMYYNFCDVHQTFARDASDRIWNLEINVRTIEELCGLLAEAASATKRI